MRNQINFGSRISVRAVVTGVMVAVASMFLLMSLIAAFGIWNYNLNELVIATPSFWVSTTLAWIVSLYVGGLIASVGARSQTPVDGMLNAVAVCSGSYLLFGTAFLLFAPSSLDVLLSTATPQFYLRAFFGDLAAVIMGTYAGVVGAHFEERSSDSVKRNHRTVSFTT